MTSTTDNDRRHQEERGWQATERLISEAKRACEKLSDLRLSPLEPNSAILDADEFMDRVVSSIGNRHDSSLFLSAILRARSDTTTLLTDPSEERFERAIVSLEQLIEATEAFVQSSREQESQQELEDRDAKLLRALSANVVLELKNKADPSFELGRVLAPVGRTIFDRPVKNIVQSPFFDDETAGRETDPQDLNDDDKLQAAAEAKAVGKMFARARGGTGLREAARASGMSHANLSKIEKGQTDPSLKTLTKIADAIDHEVRVILVPRGKS